jgi:hypothetical protein
MVMELVAAKVLNQKEAPHLADSAPTSILMMMAHLSIMRESAQITISLTAAEGLMSHVIVVHATQ